MHEIPNAIKLFVLMPGTRSIPERCPAHTHVTPAAVASTRVVPRRPAHEARAHIFRGISAAAAAAAAACAGAVRPVDRERMCRFRFLA